MSPLSVLLRMSRVVGVCRDCPAAADVVACRQVQERRPVVGDVRPGVDAAIIASEELLLLKTITRERVYPA